MVINGVIVFVRNAMQYIMSYLVMNFRSNYGVIRIGDAFYI